MSRIRECQPATLHRFAALLLALVLLAPDLALAETPPSLAGPWSGTVIRVIDGDTIVVDVDGLWETIRIIGIDTPEIVDPRKPVEAFAKEASDYTKRTLTGRTVRLVADHGNAYIGHRDRYGRLLAYVWVGEIFFNETIIRDGYAHAYKKYPFRQDYMDLFRRAEKEAREKSVGLWGPPKAAREDAK